ncbi:hypothetical protein GQX74_014746 [Glossina fuscipes]|nr:hypothetical protein GQX74_014746 [Glossina fuscipes]
MSTASKTTLNDNEVVSQRLSYGRAPPEPYYGRYVGQFTNFAHGIKGSVYAVDESTLFVKSFAYDGTGPDAFFWVGKTPRPSPEGYIIPYPEDYMGMDEKSKHAVMSCCKMPNELGIVLPVDQKKAKENPRVYYGFAFDLQQTHACPKLSVSLAYYK